MAGVLYASRTVMLGGDPEKGRSHFERCIEISKGEHLIARVLLAEDEYINRVLIETLLKQLVVEVTSVNSGELAVKEACSGKYQLVLMDVQMEGIDGLEATRRIRKNLRNRDGSLVIVPEDCLGVATE